MAKIFAFDLDPLEQGLVAISCVLSDGLRFPLVNREYIVVGTGYVLPGESEPSKGRILVFEIDKDIEGGGGGGGSAKNSVAMDHDEVDETRVHTHAHTGGLGSPRILCVCERAVKGAVYSLAGLEGRLIAGIGSKVGVI